MSKVEVKSLFKEYSGRQVLKGITFSVQKGEFFVLLGPNGSGKTTLLKILDLLEEPTSGEVWLNGEPVDYSSSKERVMLRRRIGMVFQQTVLFNMSVLDNVAYPLKVRGERNFEQKVKSVLELVQLKGFERKNALTLSGGEAQRVAIAQALVTEPELLLLDEPTANLDPKNASIVEEVISHINREKEITIIMTTHNVSQVENLADRVAILDGGRMELLGTFQEIFRSPSPNKNLAMDNIFHGVSRITNEGTSIIDIGDGVHIEAAFKRVGNVTIHVPPEDIILSKYPLISSARNTFEGTITQITDIGHIVRLRVKVMSIKDFIVQVTKRSFNEMQLNIGSKVYIAFKASSVQAN
ncbi:MAG: ABC transporter ATP-binding protein [Candidatus Bathyarchaeia archaeon]|nr:ABC transporter ATP-binding protein [Candidatus Bathyarchaeota archaeon]